MSKYLRAWHVASLLGLFVLLHWLYAMHLKTPFDAYVMNPHERVPLIANSSPALQLIKSRSAEPFRSAGLGATLHPGYGAAVGIEQIDGADALVNSHFRALMNAAGIKLVNGAWRYEISSERLANDLPLFNMLNIRYILAPPTTPLAQIPDIKNIASLDLTVYESERVWPRAFFTDRLFTYQGEEQFIQALKTSGKTPFAAIAKDNLKTEPSLNNFLSTMTPSTPRQTVAATDYALTTNGTSFSVKAPGPGVVVLTEAYMSHDFQLRVNGRPENYFRIDSAFKGFFVPRAGDYDVSFVYWPRYFTLLLVMSGVGIAALASWLVVLSRSSPSVS